MNAENRETLLVTGLRGLIGAVLQRRAGTSRLVSLDLADGIDITDADALDAAVAAHPEARALIHLAAFTDVSAAHRQEGDEAGACFCVNVLGTRNVARACTAHGLHMVLVSTDFVFDGEKQGAYTEDDVPRPIEWYGRTKWMAEHALSLAPAWTIGRIAFPYVAGPSARPDLVRKILAKLRAGETATLFDDQWITPTFADDIADGLLLCARTRPAGEVFHLVGSQSLTPCDLGRAIAATFDLDPDLVVPSKLVDYLRRDPRPRQVRLALSNARWSAFAGRHGLASPLDVATGLERVRAAGVE